MRAMDVAEVEICLKETASQLNHNKVTLENKAKTKNNKVKKPVEMALYPTFIATGGFSDHCQTDYNSKFASVRLRYPLLSSVILRLCPFDSAVPDF